MLIIISDVLSFQSVFHCWLHDCNMDSEHLSLSLPPSGSGEHDTHTTPGNMDMTLLTDPDNNSVGINLKCDLYERVVDPTSLPSVTDRFVSVMHCSISPYRGYIRW